MADGPWSCGLDLGLGLVYYCGLYSWSWSEYFGLVCNTDCYAELAVSFRAVKQPAGVNVVIQIATTALRWE